jgi:hypothetical protein
MLEAWKRLVSKPGIGQKICGAVTLVAAGLVTSIVAALGLFGWEAEIGTSSDLTIGIVFFLVFLVAMFALPSMIVVALPALLVARARGWATGWKPFAIIGLVNGTLVTTLVVVLFTNPIDDAESVFHMPFVGGVAGAAGSVFWWYAFERFYCEGRTDGHGAV